jgi:hypothetical protein
MLSGIFPLPLDRHLYGNNISSINLVCKFVLKRVNISDSFKDDVKMGDIVLGSDAGDQIFQPVIGKFVTVKMECNLQIPLFTLMRKVTLTDL